MYHHLSNSFASIMPPTKINRNTHLFVLAQTPTSPGVCSANFMTFVNSSRLRSSTFLKRIQLLSTLT